MQFANVAIGAKELQLELELSAVLAVGLQLYFIDRPCSSICSPSPFASSAWWFSSMAAKVSANDSASEWTSDENNAKNVGKIGDNNDSDIAIHVKTKIATHHFATDGNNVDENDPTRIQSLKTITNLF
jgi:hypothetical protein